MPFAASSNFQTYCLAGNIPSLLRLNHCNFSISVSTPTTTISFFVSSMADDTDSIEQKTTTVKITRKRRAREPKQKNASRNHSNNNEIEDIEDFCSDEALKIRASLLEWYDQNQRDLPWRRISHQSTNLEEEEEEEEARRAYAVWVSEVMLQQTRVQTVIDYYNRWMHKWPSLQHLAQASLEEVNEMWAGLGYYRRARFLLEGSKMIAEGQGGFPKTVSALLKVPGIGNYTAGAIASIAFKEAVPVVDGNVIRVIARLKAVSTNPKDSVTVKNFWRLAGQLVDPCRPGDFNQALMELGATICSPSTPSCSSCPVSGQCRALLVSKHCKSALVTDYPIKVVKAKQRHEFSAVCVVEILEGQDILEGTQSESGLYILVKRPDEGLLAGLWEFPSVLLDGEADLTTRREAIDNYLKKSFKLAPKKTCSIVFREDVGEYVHVFSHIRLKMYVELLVLHLKGGINVLNESRTKKAMAWKCIDSKTLSSMGLTSGVKKVYSMIQKFKQPSDPIPAKTRKSRSLRN